MNVSVYPRYLLYGMLFFGLLLSMLSRVYFYHVFMNPLIYYRAANESDKHCPLSSESFYTEDDRPEFRWDADVQTYLLQFGFLCSTVGSLPLGMAVDKFGSKTLLGLSVFVLAISSIITPLCARMNPYVLLSKRIFDSFFDKLYLSAVPAILSRWCRFTKIGLTLSILYLHYPIAFVILGLLDSTVERDTWTISFYVIGIASIVWCLLWIELIYDDPFDYPNFTDDDLLQLASQVPLYAQRIWLEPGWSWPWKQILSSTSVWTLIAAEIGYCNFWQSTLFSLPIFYLNSVLNININNDFGHIVVYHLLGACSLIAAGIITDWIVDCHAFNITHVTKVFYFISSIIGPICLIGMVQAECSLKLALFWYASAIVCVYISFFLQMMACLSMSPNFVGTIAALTSSFCMVPSLLQPKVIQLFELGNNYDSWKTYTTVNAVMSIVPTLIYLKFGNVQLQPWNHPNLRKTDLEVEDSDLKKSVTGGSPRQIAEPRHSRLSHRSRSAGNKSGAKKKEILRSSKIRPNFYSTENTELHLPYPHSYPS